MSSQPVLYDPPALPPIGATIRITSDGIVTVRRDRGCTADNVHELCTAFVAGELTIVDVTDDDRSSPTSPLA